jgi:di/tricarboxylate transporter
MPTRCRVCGHGTFLERTPPALTDATITFAILFAAVVLFVWNRVPIEIVAIDAAFSLYASGNLDLRPGPVPRDHDEAGVPRHLVDDRRSRGRSSRPMPGEYSVGDYWKLGLPMLLWFFVVSIAVIPIFWPF